MRAPPLAVLLLATSSLVACSGSYGEVIPTGSPPPPSTPTQEPAKPETTTTPAPEKTPTPKPTSFFTCSAAIASIQRCALPADIAPLAQFAVLQTTTRPTENPNSCSGCNSACTRCHLGKERAFETEFTTVPIEWVLGCAVQQDGSVELRRTDALDQHEKQVALMAAYAHPAYTLTANVRTARDDAAAVLLARLAKGECKSNALEP